MQLTSLSDDEIVARVRAMNEEGHRLLARFLAHLGELDARRLYADAGYPSFYEYCRDALRMSESAALRRVAAARLVRRFPALLAPIERGDLHLSALGLLREHLTEASFDDLVAAASGKSARAIEAMLAARAPKPEAPPSLLAVPTPVPMPYAASDMAAAASPARLTPIAEERFELRVTLSRETRDKLQRAKDLLMHANPTGELASVVDRALDVLLERLEKKRFAKASRPRSVKRERGRDNKDRTSAIAEATHTENERSRIPATVVRAVFERDGHACTYVAPDGKACGASACLELDHIVPRACGGGDGEDSLRVVCRAHNRMYAERVFGKEHVEASISLRRRRWDVEGAELAARGLVLMGFAARDVKHAIESVARRHAMDATPLPQAEIVREALGVLT
ncbi:MAG TPA: HNH endonuclease [Labilithrix sp.]|jgi:5-methylcytosine-specific restriction endonuclease McrA